MSGRHLTAGALNLDCWDRAAPVESWGHMPQIRGPDARVMHPVDPTAASGQYAGAPHLDPNSSISWGCQYKWFGRLGLTLLTISIENTS